MDGIILSSATTTTTTTSSFSINRFLFSSFSSVRTKRNLSFSRKSKFSIYASKEEPQLNEMDRMELKFGRLIGEDPKLTLAKIMGKKLNPDASYLDIEKSFHKRNGKVVKIVEIPLDWAKEKKPSSSLEGLNLVRPVPKKGVKYEVDDRPSSSLEGLNLVRPVPKKGVKFEVDDKPVVPKIKKPSQFNGNTVDSTTKRRVPNVILRKPTLFNEDDVEDRPSKFKFKPNLSLKMSNDTLKERFSDMTLLRRPEATSPNADLDPTKESPESGIMEAGISGDGVASNVRKEEEEDGFHDFMLLDKPELKADFEEKQEKVGDVESKVTGHSAGLEAKNEGVDKPRDIILLNKPEVKGDFEEKQEQFGDIESKGTSFVPALYNELEATATFKSTEGEVEKSLEVGDALTPKDTEPGNTSTIEMQALNQILLRSTEEETFTHDASDTNLAASVSNSSVIAALQGKPQRLDQSMRETIKSSTEVKLVVDPERFENTMELKDLPSVSASEDVDWNRAEDLINKGQRAEVELISSSTRGFVASFGALIGFLPYRNLAARSKFLAFESWLRQKGLDPAMYRQSLGVIGSNDVMNENYSFDARKDPEVDSKVEQEVSPDMKLEDLLRIYDKEKMKYLSSFVGQRVKVNLVMADRKSRKLIFSVRPKEKEEFVLKKRSLMAKLRLGDVVECCIKKITYFGIFVEVEGVPALIHQTEVSWDATLDPLSYFRIGQTVEAKVHQLDFSLERIFLSLKEITPDPLIEALESVVGDHDQLDGRLEAAEPDTEWEDVEILIKELQQVTGIQSVSKGPFFLSPGLTPTFQVYMASMFENQYKLLARSGNKVQEVIVEASLSKEEMKSTILSCTNKVA